MSIVRLPTGATAACVALAGMLAACVSAPPDTAVPALSPRLTSSPLATETTGYPPPHPTPEPTPTLDLRPVTLASSPYGAILTSLQQALDGGDTAALVARKTDLLQVQGAGMGEGNKVFRPQDARRVLDAFFAADSKPRIERTARG